MDKQTLDTLRSKLPAKYLKIISEITGFSRSYVHKVMIGDRENDTIIDAAIALAEKKQEQKQKLESVCSQQD